MEEQYYKKIEIKNINDLPKETGGYFVFDNKYGVSSDFYNNDESSKTRWIEHFDYYLLPSPQETIKDELPDWSKPINDQLDVPDELMPLFNKVGMQMRFHTISGKNEITTVAHIVQIAHEFFCKVKYQKSK
jgi:hypothetical protein